VVVFAGPPLLVFGLPAWLIMRRRAARRRTPTPAGA
jgi:cytochrome c oxidase assembly factor CtaG